MGEPSIAIDPRDGRHLAIAAVANIYEVQANDEEAMPVVGGLLGSPTAPTPCAQFNACLFVSTDGGATWANALVPAPDGWRATFDPQVVFDANGRLHLVVMVSQESGSRLEHLVTEDDGRTWSEPALLPFAPRADRPWLRVSRDGELLMTWLAGTATGWAASWDGRSWRSGFVEDCRINSPPVGGPEGFLFLCFGDQATLAVQVATEATVVGRFAAPRWFEAPLRTTDGQLLGISSHTRDGDATLSLRWSRDEGRSWSKEVDLRRGIPELQKLRHSCLMAAALDNQGQLHVIVAGIAEKAEVGQLCLRADAERTLLHVVAEASDGAIVGTHILGGPHALPTPRPSRSGPPTNDDFHDLVTVGDATWAAWSNGGVIQFAQVA